MAWHPRKAVPGAIHGRRRVLPVERAGEVFELTAAGWTMRDMAGELGVSLRALYYGQSRCSEIAEALDRGRTEHARRLAAERAAALAAERQAAREAAQQVMALLGIAQAPAAPPDATSTLSLDTVRRAARPAPQAHPARKVAPRLGAARRRQHQIR